MEALSTQAIITVMVCLAVVLLIAFEVIDMLLAAMLGVSVLVVCGVFTERDLFSIVRTGGGPIALLFGGMVIARTLAPTGIFDNLGTRYLRATKGSGRRFLLGLVLLGAAVGLLVPNAAAVILLAPIIIQVARALDVDFVGPIIFTALTSNAAGLLTMVGDPATYLVASSVGFTFVGYLQKASLGGLIALLIVIPVMAWSLKSIWQVRRVLPSNLTPVPLEHPRLCVASLSVLVLMMVMFIVGEYLPNPLLPPLAALIAASLALLLIQVAQIEPIERVVHDIDWRTLLIIFLLFALVGSIEKTGLLGAGGRWLYATFGTDLVAVTLVTVAVVGVLSSIFANIPILAGMLLTFKGYFVTAQFVPELAMGPDFRGWPTEVFPVFIAMMFAGSLGGNATMIGSPANMVAVGICARNDRPVKFGEFLRYGLPLAVIQLTVAALYVLTLLLG